jgi:DNA-binding NtrC family response regulator
MSRSLTIMVVDDEPTVCKRLQRALARLDAGIEVSIETFVDPHRALARLDEKSFDIVVTDVVMPEVTGVHVLEHALRRSERTRVVIITGFAMMSLAREAMDKGAFDFVAKPFRIEALREVVLRAVESLDAEGPEAGAPLSRT